jgi:hypothetical protein
MNREHNGNQDQLGDHGKEDTTDHHYQEVSLVVDHSIQVEFVIPIRNGLTTTKQFHHTVPENKEVTLLDGGYPLTRHDCVRDHSFILHLRCRCYVLEHRVVVDNIRVGLYRRILQQIRDVVCLLSVLRTKFFHAQLETDDLERIVL